MDAGNSNGASPDAPAEVARTYYDFAVQQYDFVSNSLDSHNQRAAIIFSGTLVALGLAVQGPVSCPALKVVALTFVFGSLVMLAINNLRALSCPTAERAKDLHEKFKTRGHPHTEILMQRASTLDDSTKELMEKTDWRWKWLNISLFALLTGIGLFGLDYLLSVFQG